MSHFHWHGGHVAPNQPQCLVEGETAEWVHVDADFFAFCHRVLLSTPRAPSTAAEGARALSLGRVDVGDRDEPAALQHEPFFEIEGHVDGDIEWH